jgi:hypothetical protein
MIGWFQNVGSCTTTNRVDCYTLSYTSFSRNGIEIHPQNFRRFVCFSTYKNDCIISQSDWLTNGNRYLTPNKNMDKIK